MYGLGPQFTCGVLGLTSSLAGSSAPRLLRLSTIMRGPKGRQPRRHRVVVAALAMLVRHVTCPRIEPREIQRRHYLQIGSRLRQTHVGSRQHRLDSSYYPITRRRMRGVVRAKNVVRQGRLASFFRKTLHYCTIWQYVHADLRHPPALP